MSGTYILQWAFFKKARMPAQSESSVDPLRGLVQMPKDILLLLTSTRNFVFQIEFYANYCRFRFFTKRIFIVGNMLVLNSSMRQQDINGEKDTNWVLSCLTTHPEESSYEFTLTFYYSYVEFTF